jgi:hypothetical protein
MAFCKFRDGIPACAKDQAHDLPLCPLRALSARKTGTENAQ